MMGRSCAVQELCGNPSSSYEDDNPHAGFETNAGHRVPNMLNK